MITRSGPRQGDGTAALRGLGAVARGYSAVFAANPLAPLLSPGRPVRRTGFERVLAVDDARLVAGDVAVITLRSTSGDPLPSWTPGAHLEVTTAGGRLRHYSLCGDPGDRSRYRLAVRRILDGHGGSAELHALTSGDLVTVRGPRNAFPLATRADGYLFIAAGIGITPLLPMVSTVAGTRAPWRMIYIGRSRASMPFLGELSELSPARVQVLVSDEVAVRPDVADLLQAARPGEAVYVCGPAPMLDRALHAAPGLAPGVSLHLERFATPGLPAGRPFALALRRTGRVLQVGAAQSALEAVRAVLPDVPYSCTRGFCGTCRTRVLAGQVEHHDRVLRPHERTREMTLCVSRGTGDTVLEVDL